MITYFQSIIHRHGRWIFLILLGFILVAFLLWDYAGVATSNVQTVSGSGVVYGRKIGTRELDLAQRRLLLQSGRRVHADERTTAQVLHRLALLEKARRLGITASDEEVVERVRQIFMDKNGQYDSAAYVRFVTERLLPGRLTEGDFEILIREEIILRNLTNVITSTVKVTPRQATAIAREVSEIMTVLACRFELNEYLAQVKPAHEELVGFYRQQPDHFRMPEKVRVSYVAFPIQPTKINVTEQELQEAYDANRAVFTMPDGKVKSLKEVENVLRSDIGHQKMFQEAIKRATEFTVQMVGEEEGKALPPFDILAKQYGFEVKQTAFFGSNELAPGISTPEFTTAAFKVNAENPVSDPVLSTNAVYVLHFLEKKASFLPPFEEVVEIVKNSFTADKALKLARENGNKKRQELIELLKSGKSFEQAASLLKLKSQMFKGFCRIDALPEDPYESTARLVSFQMPAGQVSDFIPNAAGGFFVYVASRQSARNEEVTKLMPQIQQELLQLQQQYLLHDFNQTVMQEAGIQSAYSELMGRAP